MPSGKSDGARADQAADWFARMRGPDADSLRLEFERWRAGDAGNRAAYARLEGLWQASAGLAGTEMGRAPIFVRRQSIFAMRGPRFAFASMALAVVAGTGAFLLTRPGAPVVMQSAPSLATGVGEIRTLRLADGSTVTLDTDSAIEVAMSGSARVLRLVRGRARFDVAHDPARPFSVEADGKTVTARGTLFDVGLSREGVRVTLLRGSVEVRDAAPGPGTARAASRLAPGQTFVSGQDRGPRVTASAAGGDQWVKGMLSFDGAPLSAVVEEANRYSPHKLRLADSGLAMLRVTGVFQALPTEKLAAALAAAFDLRVERAPNGDFVLRSR